MFDRSRQQIQLTEAGLLFVNRARDLLARGDELEREVSLLNGDRGGQLNLGAGPYAAELIVRPVLKTLLSGRPGLRIRVGIDHWLSLVRRLRSGEFSLVIAEFSELTGEPDLEIRPLTTHQGYFLVRTDHPLLKRPKTTVKDVLQFPLAMASNLPSRVMGPFLRDLPKSSIKPHLALITDNLDIIREVISGTDIIGIFTLSQVEAELEKAEVGGDSLYRGLASFPVRPDHLEAAHRVARCRKPLSAWPWRPTRKSKGRKRNWPKSTWVNE